MSSRTGSSSASIDVVGTELYVLNMPISAKELAERLERAEEERRKLRRCTYGLKKMGKWIREQRHDRDHRSERPGSASTASG